nr:transcriptional regulator [Pseudoduganella ginsengisoli]
MNVNAKRDIFAELVEGFDALEAEREGKKTLRRHKVEVREVAPVTPAELVSLRNNLGMSRPVMARYLRINDRTLENWEQGRSKPNDQACTLIRLVEKYPDMLERLASV